MNKTCFILVGTLLMVLLVCCDGPDKGTGTSRKTDSLSAITRKPTAIQPIQDINVYLENSGSMDGYVKGNTGFEQSVYAYLTELQISKLIDTLNLNYINSKVIPRGHDVETFIHNIEPVDFRKHGGNLGTSDIAVVLDSILQRHDKEDISIFISDCIVSPGKKYASSPQSLNNYLLEQRTRIKKSFISALDKTNNDLSVVVCQLTSLFDGRFYNKFDQPKYYKGERPFYIWLIGSTSHIKQLQDKVTLEPLKGSGAELENVYTLVASPKTVDYGILLAPRLGRFEPDRANPRTAIRNIRKENRGKQRGMFMFSFGANLNQLPLDESYVLNAAHYAVSNKDYALSVKEQRSGRFSHIFSLSSQIASRGNLTIALKNQFPQWIACKTDSVGNDLVKDEATEKTYGLKYLLEGVYDAFTARQKDYAVFKITIN